MWRTMPINPSSRRKRITMPPAIYQITTWKTKRGVEFHHFLGHRWTQLNSTSSITTSTSEHLPKATSENSSAPKPVTHTRKFNSIPWPHLGCLEGDIILENEARNTFDYLMCWLDCANYEILSLIQNREATKYLSRAFGNLDTVGGLSTGRFDRSTRADCSVLGAWLRGQNDPFALLPGYFEISQFNREEIIRDTILSLDIRFFDPSEIFDKGSPKDIDHRALALVTTSRDDCYFGADSALSSTVLPSSCVSNVGLVIGHQGQAPEFGDRSPGGRYLDEPQCASLARTNNRSLVPYISVPTGPHGDGYGGVSGNKLGSYQVQSGYGDLPTHFDNNNANKNKRGRGDDIGDGSVGTESVKGSDNQSDDEQICPYRVFERLTGREYHCGGRRKFSGFDAQR